MHKGEINMQDALVSVIVPVYKVEKYLDKCIESIVGQTYKNLEIILVDDGSPDNCPAMCDLWAQKDSRIKVIHKPNGGVSSARNMALDAASGEYICFVDSDDVLELDTVKYMVDNISDADVIQCGLIYCYADGTSLDVGVPDSEFYGEDAQRAVIMDYVRPEVCGKLYAAKLFDNIRFDTSKRYGEDFYINYNLMKSAKKMISRNVCLYHYVFRNESATADYMTDDRANLYKITGIMAENERCGDLYEACVYRHTRTLFAILSRLILGNKEYYDKYFDSVIKEILSYKKEILKNRYLGFKFKISTAIISINPKLFVFVNRLIRK